MIWSFKFLNEMGHQCILLDDFIGLNELEIDEKSINYVKVATTLKNRLDQVLTMISVTVTKKGK